jgi:hypothetical protein
MKNFTLKNFFSTVLLSFFCFGFFQATAGAESFTANLPTGVLELEEFNQPVHLFVPSNYADQKDLSLLIVLADEKDDLEKDIKIWAKALKAEKTVVVMPVLKFQDKDAPLRTDAWLLRIKKDLSARYQIKKTHVYLQGLGNRAHYAAYLGLKYPKQFAAIAMVGGSWVGPFEKSVRTAKTPRKQTPFLAVFNEGAEGLAPAQERAKELVEKGYLVEFMKLSSGETISTDSVKVKIVGWLRDRSLQWNTKIQTTKKSFKEKVSIGIENFFHIE